MDQKGVPKNASKKGTPQESNKTLFAGREAPGDDASRAHFQQKKTTVQTATAATTATVAEIAALVQLLFEFVARI